MCDEFEGVPPDEIERWIVPREQLNVFKPPRPRSGDDTNSASAAILRMIR